MADSSIADLIRERAIANGVDPATLLQFGKVESDLNPNAGASGSSAKGLFQFTDPTAQRYGLTDPYDPAASADAAARLLKDNQSVLQSNGLPVTPGTLYLSHFAGAGGATKLLKADDTAPAGDILGPAAVRANPFLAGMTVGGVKNWANRKMAGAGGGLSAPAAPMQVASAAPAMPITPPSVASSVASPSSTPGVDPSALLAQIPKLIAQQTPQLHVPAPLQPSPLPPGILKARALARAIAQNPLMLSQGVPT